MALAAFPAVLARLLPRGKAVARLVSRPEFPTPDPIAISVQFKV